MPELYDTIVIGGGQAGLAAGYYLRRAGERFLILDAHARIGDGWRQRWEGLRLFSPQRYNALPGLPPPADPWYLPDRREIADYLETYARRFTLPLSLRCTCAHARKLPSGNWLLSTNKGELLARRIVVASGAYRTPFRPAAVADSFPAPFAQYHSSEIRDPAALADATTDVLVVGAGASGQQLSRLFAAAGASVTLAGPAVANLPRRLLGRDIYWWLYRSGMMTLRTDRYPGKWLAGAAGGGDVTVGEPPLPAAVHRVETELARYAAGRLHWNCQRTAPTPLPWPAPGRRGLVVWCTGYRNAYPWLPPAMLDERGQPLLRGARSKVYPEVIFLGLPNLRRPNSSLVGGVGADAGAVLPP